MEKIIDLFRMYLENEKIALVSTKNYLVDLRNFFEWFILFLKTKQVDFDENQAVSLASLINQDNLSVYKSFLLHNNTPFKTINRRFSALRKFCTFAVSQGWLTQNHAKKIANVGTLPKTEASSIDLLLREFQTDLEIQRINRITIKNYLADTKQFLGFINTI